GASTSPSGDRARPYHRAPRQTVPATPGPCRRHAAAITGRGASLTTARFDAITLEELRARGGIKWSRHPGKIGAFIAEMDFGTAPPITRALHDAVDEGAFGYLPPRLVGRLAEACAEWYRTRYGWDVPASRIRPLPDVIAAFSATIQYFTRPGSPIILPSP